MERERGTGGVPTQSPSTELGSPTVLDKIDGKFVPAPLPPPSPNQG